MCPVLSSLATVALSTFSRSTLAVYFVLSYQTIADELYASHDKAVDAAAVEAAYLAVCTRIATQLREAGYRSVTTAIADKQYLRLDPLVRPRFRPCYPFAHQCIGSSCITRTRRCSKKPACPQSSWTSRWPTPRRCSPSPCCACRTT